jgi:hypothetical protein
MKGEGKKKECIKRKQRYYDKQELMELESLRSSNEIRVYYQKLNESRKDFQPGTTLCRDNEGMILGRDETILERWTQHFEELLNGNTLERVEDMTMVQNQGHFEIEEPVPTINEIEQAIKRLRNNKVPGIDLILAELVKFALTSTNS